jgi:molybdenum cofactor synthesis domain-containing protein
MLKKVKLENAIGQVIAHDMTKVDPGKYKGPRFRRGHVVKEEDLPELRLMGKEHIYVLEGNDGLVHEEEAALRIARAVATPDFQLSQPKEGRVNIISPIHGLLKTDLALLKEINSIDNIVLAARHNNSVCQPGNIAAGTKIVPLLIEDEVLAGIEKLCAEKGPVFRILPFQKKKVGLVITGGEVFKGLIKDRFGSIIKTKVEALGSSIYRQTIVPDDEEIIGNTIKDMAGQGCDLIIVAGGLSVDPDDVTVEGVEKSGAEIISYGAPVMPGAMFLNARLGDIPILGAPGAVIFRQTTIVDLILPRVLAGESVSKEDIADFGNGGLCLECEACVYPICPFGR